MAQHLLQARTFEDRHRVLAQQRMAGGGRVYAVGEQVGGGRIRADVAGRVAGEDAGGGVSRVDPATGVGDVAETVHGRVGRHFTQHGEGVERDELDAGLLQAAIQGLVVAGRQRGGLRGTGRAQRTELRGNADVGQVGNEHVLGTGLLEGAHKGHLVGDGRADDGLRLGRRTRCGEQVVGTAPDRVQGIGVSLAAIGSQVAGRLALQRWDGAQGTGHVDTDTGTADSVVVAVLAVAVGSAIEAVVVGHLLRPHPTRVGGELARDRAHVGRQQRTEVASVGQAVAEEDSMAVRGFACHGRQRGQRDRGRHEGADRAFAEQHVKTPVGISLRIRRTYAGAR
ncbi:Chorionicgonadotropic hormone-like protein [compost metagenome]